LHRISRELCGALGLDEPPADTFRGQPVFNARDGDEAED
jgi:hypothetical protein